LTTYRIPSLSFSRSETQNNPKSNATEVLPRPTSCHLLHGINSHHQQHLFLKEGTKASILIRFQSFSIPSRLKILLFFACFVEIQCGLLLIKSNIHDFVCVYNGYFILPSFARILTRVSLCFFWIWERFVYTGLLLYVGLIGFLIL
jgi:hypothetical protein